MKVDEGPGLHVRSRGRIAGGRQYRTVPAKQGHERYVGLIAFEAFLQRLLPVVGIIATAGTAHLDVSCGSQLQGPVVEILYPEARESQITVAGAEQQAQADRRNDAHKSGDRESPSPQQAQTVTRGFQGED